MKKLLVIALVLAPVLMASADQQKIEPGQWQIVINLEMTGMPFQMPPQTVNHCIKPEDVRSPKDLVQLNQKNKDCQISNLKQTGSKVSWTMACKGAHGTGNGSGEITYAPDSYHGIVHMNLTDPRGTAHTMTEKFDARRTGACP